MKQAALCLLGIAALLCTISGLYVGAYMAAVCGTILLFPVPSCTMLGVAALAFWRAERV